MLSRSYLTPARLLWLANEMPETALNHLKMTTTPDPAVNSTFKLGTAAQTAIGLSGLSAAHLHFLRTGVEQDVQVDARHAVLEFHSEAWYTLDGNLNGNSIWDNIAGVYKTKGDGFVRIHTNFPHHRQGILDILKCQPTREDVAEALLRWDAVEFETEAASRKMCATALRPFEEWDTHAQAIALQNTPPVILKKIGEAPRRVCNRDYSRPLGGIRVLDLSRVLAGPICGRTLAVHGADVLLVTSPNLPDLPILDMETSRGKRTTQLDLNHTPDRDTLFSLVKDADVFLQAYRPGGLADKGFDAHHFANIRPGLVYASLNAYGWDGPWKHRRGFDSLVQTATGFNVAEGQAYTTYSNDPFSPRPLPMQAIDHAAGYLLSFGINAALCKTITEGGSWEVRVSLAAVGQWIRSLGQLTPELAFGQGKPFPQRALPQDPEIASLSDTIGQSQDPTRRGDWDEEKHPRNMSVLRHAAILSKTPVQLGAAPMGLNVHTPSWLPRV